MAEHPLDTMRTLDPKLFSLVEETQHLALGEGVLPRKFKLLIALALDAAHGAVEGVRALTQQAMKAGATKEEITEAIRVAQYTSGVSSVYTASRALKELF